MKKATVFGLFALMLFWPHESRAAEGSLLTESDGIRVGYDKGFVLSVGDQFELKFQGFLQFQHLYTDFDKGNSQSTFKVAKGRLRWSGFAYHPGIGYVIQLEVANPQKGRNITVKGGDDISTGTLDEDNNVSLKDFLVDIKHYPRAKVRIGQFKVPFNRQQLAFFADLQFVDTSLASQRFNANQTNARDIGILLSGSRPEQFVQYFVGIFNGNGINNTNDASRFMTMARVVVNPLGAMSISESDVANSETPLLSVGAGFAYDSANKDKVTSRGTAKTAALEFAFKHRGKSVQGEYYSRDDDANPDADGLYLQGGIFLIPHKLELTARYALFSPDGANNDEDEITGGVNLFFAGHRRKFQINVSSMSDDNNNADDLMVRSQYQFSF